MAEALILVGPGPYSEERGERHVKRQFHFRFGFRVGLDEPDQSDDGGRAGAGNTLGESEGHAQ